MEGALDLESIPAMSADSISLSFSVGKQHLKARVSHEFESEQATPDQWGVMTWSKKVAKSMRLCASLLDSALLRLLRVTMVASRVLTTLRASLLDSALL